MSEPQEKIKLTDLVSPRPNTQIGLIARILEKNKNKKMSKREIEKLYTFYWAFRDVKDEDIKSCGSIEELMSISDEIPGDVQRQLRTLHKKAKKYGLNQEKKKKHELSYTWNPINKCDCDNIIPPCARNIFKTPQECDRFINKDKKGKCECCGANMKDEKILRMAIDHWRAHSSYNIDDKRIAVLLCEKCNNIHHNHDASVIAVKYKYNMNVITNWKNIELRIRENGFPPNEKDIEDQKKNIEIITNYWKDELRHPLPENFWEGLF